MATLVDAPIDDRARLEIRLVDTAAEIAVLDERRDALVAERDALVVLLGSVGEPARRIAALAKMCVPDVTALLGPVGVGEPDR